MKSFRIDRSCTSLGTWDARYSLHHNIQMPYKIYCDFSFCKLKLEGSACTLVCKINLNDLRNIWEAYYITSICQHLSALLASWNHLDVYLEYSLMSILNIVHCVSHPCYYHCMNHHKSLRWIFQIFSSNSL